MSDIERDRSELTRDLERLLALLPAISERPADDPARRAWVIWKHALITQILALERRERDLQAEPSLWIELSMADIETAGIEIEQIVNTRADLQ